MTSERPVGKAKKKKGGFTATDWPAEGDVSDRGYCRSCSSFWCPHAAPSIYEKRDLRRFYNGRGPRVAADGGGRSALTDAEARLKAAWEAKTT